MIRPNWYLPYKMVAECQGQENNGTDRETLFTSKKINCSRRGNEGETQENKPKRRLDQESWDAENHRR